MNHDHRLVWWRPSRTNRIRWPPNPFRRHVLRADLTMARISPRSLPPLHSHCTQLQCSVFMTPSSISAKAVKGWTPTPTAPDARRPTVTPCRSCRRNSTAWSRSTSALSDRATRCKRRSRASRTTSRTGLPRTPARPLSATSRAKDAHVRQSLLDRYGSTRQLAIGSKSRPGPLYGISGHSWAALAVAVSFVELRSAKACELEA